VKPISDLTKMQDGFPAACRLFSSSVIREMARKGRSPLFARLARESNLLGLSSQEQVSSLFEAAFSLLKREGFRHEYIYKAALTHKILLGTYSLQTASMLTEFRVRECKADLVILNGTATVYEVKSERDSLTRLERQISAYLDVFAQVYVIAPETHLCAVKAAVPREVGIMSLTSRYQISTLRESVCRPSRTSAAAIFDSIRTDEARTILRMQGVTIPDVPNTELSSFLRKLFSKLDGRTAHAGMVAVLKKTRNLLPLSELVFQMPRSLQPAALSVPMRKRDHERLISAVNTRLEDAVLWS
jgi:hypothetical protein